MLGALVLFCPLSPFVYYADFRSIESKFARLPAVTVAGSWKHEDLTLEDFGFVLRVRDCPPVRVDFYEGREWHGLFRRIDGIVVCPGDAMWDGTEAKIIPVSRLSELGPAVRTLPDVIANLGDILELAERMPANGAWPGPAGLWAVIRYPLK